MITIPSRDTKTFLQTNRSNILGNLWSTWNADFTDNAGTVRVANKMKLNTKTGDADATNLGIPWAIKAFDGMVFAGAGTRIFKNGANNLYSAFVNDDGSTGAQTDYDPDIDDMEVFNGVLCATNNGDLYSKAANAGGAGAWTSRGTIGSINFANKLAYFFKFNRLYCSNNKTIKSIDSSWSLASSGDYTLTITTPGTISTIAAGPDSIWIGTINSLSNGGLGRGASILEWDGISAQVTKEHLLPGTQGVMAITVDESGRPVVLDSNGRFRLFTGSGFQEIGRLPLRANQYLGFPTNSDSTRAIHPNGMVATPDNTVLALICNRDIYENGTTEHVNENLPSGIWELNLSTGSCTHKHSLTYATLTSSSLTDYGQNRIEQAGALAQLKDSGIDGQTTLVCGAKYYTDATTSTSGIFVQAPFPTDDATYPEGQKYGYYVSTWMLSQNLKDSWQKMAAKFREFIESTDKIVLKYRTRETDATEISITWNGTSSFTTTTDVSAYTGYEVEVIQGTGSGKCAHISSVSESGGTYTVNLDDTFTGVTTGTAKARLQDWTKIGEITEQNIESKVLTIPNATSERIQLKVCMQFTEDDEIHEVILINKPHTKLE